MTRRIMVIGAGARMAAALISALESTGTVVTVATRQVETLSRDMEPFDTRHAYVDAPPGPVFGDARPYLKKKKGRS